MMSDWPHAARLRTSLLLSVLIVAACASNLHAQRPSPQLTSVFPPGGKQGTTVNVKIAGSDLDEVSQLVFSHKGISSSPIKEAASPVYPEGQVKQNEFEVKIAGDVPPGIYEVRTVGYFGVSTPRAFQVGTFEEVVDDGSNTTLEKAKELPVNSTANGVVAAGSRDYWKINLTAGQRVMIRCTARSIDSRMDAALLVLDAQGNELRRKRSAGSGALIDFTADQAGAYTVAVSDFLYGGGAEYFYRLSVHTGAHIDFVYPPAGAPGTTDSYTVYGRNLPGGKAVEGMKVDGAPLEQATVKITMPAAEAPMPVTFSDRVDPHAALHDNILYRMQTPAGMTNAAPVGLAAADVITEAADNDTSSTAQIVTAPCEIAGKFFPARDRDWYQFEAKKGETYWIDLLSHRLGFSTDAHLLVQKVTNPGKDEKVSDVGEADDSSTRNATIGSDFDTSTDDPTFKLTVKEDGVYRVLVRDQFGDTRSDPRFVYRLQITRQQQDFALLAAPAPTRQTNKNAVAGSSVNIRRGGLAAMDINVHRTGGFKGVVEINVEGLPTGITCTSAIAGPGDDTASLVFEATSDAVPGVHGIQVSGTASIDGKQVKRLARGTSIIWGTTNRGQKSPESRITRDLAIAVLDSETAPVKIQVGDGSIVETALGGTVELPIKLQRDAFKDALKLAPVNVPKDIKPAAISIAAGKDDGKFSLVLSSTKIEPGAYTFHLRGDAKFKYARNAKAIETATAEQKRLDDVVKKISEDAKKAPKDNSLKEMLKQAQAAKKRADQELAAAKKANAPKDITYWAISTPIRLKIAASPVEISGASATVKQEGKTEVAINIKRLYGFDDAVELTLTPPAGVKGVSAKKITLAKGQATGKFELTTTKDAPVGEHEFDVKATTKWNKVSSSQSSPLKVKIQPK